MSDITSNDTSNALTIPPESIVINGENGRTLAQIKDGVITYADDLTLDEAKLALSYALTALAGKELTE